MNTLNIYLTFDGNCEEAFNFYQSVFGGEFQTMSRFSEMPPQEGMPPLPEDELNRIMHVSLPIGNNSVLMGSDRAGGWGPGLSIGNNFSISVDASSKEEADTFFEALSDGGEVTMPMADTFWESYFGMCVDRFGINWMMSFATHGPK